MVLLLLKPLSLYYPAPAPAAACRAHPCASSSSASPSSSWLKSQAAAQVVKEFDAKGNATGFKEVMLATIGPGDAVGELAVIGEDSSDRLRTVRLCPPSASLSSLRH